MGHKRDWRSTVFELALLLSLLHRPWRAGVADHGHLHQGPAGLRGAQPDRVPDQPDVVEPERAGIGQALWGSIVLMLFVAILAIPIGVAAAIYLEEYASDNRLTRIINTTVRNLAGVPAVVYGLLGIAVFVVLLRDWTGGQSIISGGFTLAIVVLPIVIITSAESLRAVPSAIREAGYGVGATKWEVIRSHVLPYAMPGILTGTILTIGRAFGETAPLLLVGAVTGGFAVAATPRSNNSRAAASAPAAPAA